MKVLLIDNYDSFTFNLYHYISSLNVKVGNAGARIGFGVIGISKN